MVGPGFLSAFVKAVSAEACRTLTQRRLVLETHHNPFRQTVTTTTSARMICDAFNEVVQSKSQAVGTLPRTVIVTFVTKGSLSSIIEATTETVLTFLLANVKGEQAFFLRFSFECQNIISPWLLSLQRL